MTGMEPINALVTVSFLAFVVQMILERVKSHFPRLHGDVLALTAFLLGTGLAWYWDLRIGADLGYNGLPPALEYVAAGLVVAGVAGLIANTKNAMRASDPTSSLYRGPQRIIR